MIDLELILELYKMKSIRRKGWIDFGIKNAESIAEHSFLLALLAYILGKKKNLDVDKLVKMAIFHDIAEIKVGDLTPRDIEKNKKFKLEKEALIKMFGNKSEIYKLWLEYENKSSKEAKFLHELDKFERILQAYIYEIKYKTRLDEFWKEEVSDDLLKTFIDELKKRRNYLNFK